VGECTRPLSGPLPPETFSKVVRLFDHSLWFLVPSLFDHLLPSFGLPSFFLKPPPLPHALAAAQESANLICTGLPPENVTKPPIRRGFRSDRTLLPEPFPYPEADTFLSASGVL